MIHLTKYEKCLLLVIARDEYNALNGTWDLNDTPAKGDLTTWTNVPGWKNEMNYAMKMEKTKSFTLPEVKGFLGSLVKKGLVECDKESRKKENDETTYFTELGFQTIIEIKKENAMTTTTATTATKKEISLNELANLESPKMTPETFPTKKEILKNSLMIQLANEENRSQAWLIKKFEDIAGKTTITTALKELAAEGKVEKVLLDKVVCWNLLLNTTDDPAPVAVEAPIETPVETPVEAPAPKKSLKEHLKGSIKVKVKIAKEKGKVPKKEKSRYGRIASCVCGLFDDLLFAGTTMEKAVETVKVQTSKVDDLLKNRFKAHVRQLRKEGVTIIEKDGVFKAKEEKHPKK